MFQGTPTPGQFRVPSLQPRLQTTPTLAVSPPWTSPESLSPHPLGQPAPCTQQPWAPHPRGPEAAHARPVFPALRRVCRRHGQEPAVPAAWLSRARLQPRELSYSLSLSSQRHGRASRPQWHLATCTRPGLGVECGPRTSSRRTGRGGVLGLASAALRGRPGRRCPPRRRTAAMASPPHPPPQPVSAAFRRGRALRPPGTQRPPGRSTGRGGAVPRTSSVPRSTSGSRDLPGAQADDGPPSPGQGPSL